MAANKEDISLRNFCHQMLNCPQFKELMWTGSTFELPLPFILENVTDVDTLVCRNQFPVLPYNCDFAESAANQEHLYNTNHWITATGFWPRKTVLRLNSRNSHIGFTQLVYDDGMKKDTIAIIHDLRGSHSFNVCKTSTWFGQSNRVWKMFEQLTKSDFNVTRLKEMTVDVVDALHCPVWPEAATEWKTRTRHHHWPSQEVIDSIVASGCYLVAKSHDNQMENISEWRFSFSAAELALIHSWNYEQKFVYHLMRFIKIDVSRKCKNKKQNHLKTYHFKTLMLWACEKEPPEFWKRENLEYSLKRLLCTLIEWMIEKNCPNYFIPRNNMWDNIPSDYDFDMEAQTILSSIEDIKRLIKEKDHLQRENVEKRGELKVVIPNKLLVVLYQRCYSEYHVYHTMHGKHPFLPSLPLEETEYFTSKMKYLYRALIIHRNLVSHKFEKQVEEAMIEEALMSFKRFRETTFDGHTEIRFSPFDSLRDIYRKILDSNIDCNHSMFNFKNGSSIAETLGSLLFQRINDDIDHPFYFIGCAYEANFHLTAFDNKRYDIKRDHWMKALILCEEGISEEASAKEKFAHWVYPPELHLMVTVTKEFSDIFDECINSAVFISSPNNNEFETNEFSIHFSPVDFLRYVRIQCMRKLDVDFREDEEILKMEHENWAPTRSFLCNALRLSSYWISTDNK